MRFLNLVAVPHPSGNRIDLTLGASRTRRSSRACASCVVSVRIRSRLRRRHRNREL